jgi:hypothetical protein
MLLNYRLPKSTRHLLVLEERTQEFMLYFYLAIWSISQSTRQTIDMK